MRLKVVLGDFWNVCSGKVKKWTTQEYKIPVAGREVVIERSKLSRRARLSVDRQEFVEEPYGEYLRLLDGPLVADPDELLTFMRHYLVCQGFSGMVLRRNFGAITRLFLDWQALNGPKDDSGQLVSPIQCFGFSVTQGSAGQVPRCGNVTRDPAGLCHHHRKRVGPTVWSCVWGDGYECAIGKRKSREQIQQKVALREREQWEAKWRPIAQSIEYTATDRQIYYLLHLGAKPSELEGIDKKGASRRIDQYWDTHPRYR